MKDQHKKIKGYRELSQEEIDLMNDAKDLGEKLNDLCDKISRHLDKQEIDASEPEEIKRIYLAKPNSWLINGQDDLQTGLMKVVRAVAQPTTF